MKKFFILIPTIVFFYAAAFSQPVNNNPPGTQIAVGTSCSYTSGTVTGATASGVVRGTCDNYSGTPNLYDVWYNFAAQCNGSYTITCTPNSALDPVLVLYLNGQQVACSDNGGGLGGAETITTNLIGGNTYVIRIYSYGSVAPTNGSFNVCAYSNSITPPSAPTSATNSTSNNSYCGGQTAPITLFANGTLSSGAQWAWYQGGCGIGASFSSLDEPDVTPTANTTYYVREESSCGNSSCASTMITYIPQPQAPTPTTTPTTICPNATFTLNANATGSPYYWTYNGNYFSNVQNPTENSAAYGSGNYCLSYTSSGCPTATGCVTVTLAQSPTVSINPVGSVNLCSSGANSSTQLTGMGALTYVWNPGGAGNPITVSNLQSDQVYSVTGTDLNGCTATSSVNVNVTITPTVSVNPATPAVCQGEGDSLKASGTGQSYSWSPGSSLSGTSGTAVLATPTSPTTYTVTASTGDCSATASAMITVNPLPTAAVSPATTTITTGASTTLTASGGTSYLWSNGQTGTSITVSPHVDSTYTVTVTDGNGCTATAEASVTVITGISEAGNLSRLQIQPNPSHGQFTISFENTGAENMSLKIFDATSREVVSKNWGIAGGKILKQINLTTASAGVYIVQVTVGTQIVNRKITITP